jgi:hypothetical protein
MSQENVEVVRRRVALGGTRRLLAGVKGAGRRLVTSFGYEVTRRGSEHIDFDAGLVALCERVGPYTLTSKERIAALANATEYVVRRDVPGDFVECGVWHGGSAMVMALTLRRLGAANRRLWLYDTFDVMPGPGPQDVDVRGRSLREEWSQHEAAGVEIGSSPLTRCARRCSRPRTTRPWSRLWKDSFRRRSRRGHRSASRCSGSTQTGTSRRDTSCGISTPGSRRAAS